MSRVEEFKKSLEEINDGGGMKQEDWMLKLLAEIAFTLAVIADTLKDGDSH